MVKKIKGVNKKLIFLLIFGLSIFIFASCQSKAAANNNKGNKANNKSFNVGDMKKRMQDSINPLVVNKTLTKAQEDKIVDALTINPKSGQASGAKKVRTNKQETVLTKLVTQKVITKAQADAVTKVIKVNNTTHTRNSNPTQS